MTHSSKRYYPALTGLRYLAALMVYFHHFNPFKPEGWQMPFHLLCREMYVGVTVFFVLSGFLITLRYYGQSINFRSYVINRFARIYPIYFILTISTFFLSRGLLLDKYGEDFWLIFTLNLTLLKGLFGEFYLTGIAQAWSLTVEEIFYLLAPLLFWLLRKNSLLLLLAAGLFLGIGFSFSLGPKVFAHDFLKDSYFMLQQTFFGRSTEFLVGMLLARYLNPLLKMASRLNFTWLGLGFLLAGLWTMSQIKPGSFGLETPWGIVINTLILPALAIAPLILGLIREKDRLSRFFASPVMITLGKASYVFYLIHIGFITKWLYKTNTLYIDTFLHLIALTLISILLFKTLEEPLNKWVKKVLYRNRARKV